jgi:biotin synthase
LHSTIANARERVLNNGLPADRALLESLAQLPDEDVPDLLALADDVRASSCGNGIAVEVLYNAKKGGCSEDCHFCSQSARFASDVEPETLASVEGFVAAARDAFERGAGEFCIVVAVRGPSERLLERVCESVRAIKAELPLKVAVSLGILREDQVAQLVAAGVDKVNHNLETSRRYFPSVCTTHTFDERMDTLQLVRGAGLEVCCGGIIGMGETSDDRIDFLCTLQELAPEEVPINFLNPRPGTPFQDRSLVEPVEALRFVAMARLALPRALVRFAGGREITLQGLQDLGMRSGASGIVLGNYLTTGGRSDQDDFAMLERLGFEVMA